ncbi:MAG TPA: rhodanese-like domain-containing protein [Polyangiaceae bacterium]|nr:rhodanese-like domain-containing protein [Polyangiaceae bacterium]
MADVKRISPQEANGLMSEGWTYVDVRTVEEFEAGHPPGAVNVPLMLLTGGGMSQNAAFATAMKATFGQDAKIVVGCKAGGRSLKAAQILLGEGFRNVVDQRAGWDGGRNPFGQITDPGWSRVGLPVEEGQPAGRSWADVKAKAG